MQAGYELSVSVVVRDGKFLIFQKETTFLGFRIVNGGIIQTMKVQSKFPKTKMLYGDKHHFPKLADDRKGKMFDLIMNFA